MGGRRVPLWMARCLSHFLWRAKVAADLVVNVLHAKLAIFSRLVVLGSPRAYILHRIERSKALAAMWA